VGCWAESKKTTTSERGSWGRGGGNCPSGRTKDSWRRKSRESQVGEALSPGGNCQITLTGASLEGERRQQQRNTSPSHEMNQFPICLVESTWEEAGARNSHRNFHGSRTTPGKGPKVQTPRCRRLPGKGGRSRSGKKTK